MQTTLLKELLNFHYKYKISVFKCDGPNEIINQLKKKKLKKENIDILYFLKSIGYSDFVEQNVFSLR